MNMGQNATPAAQSPHKSPTARDGLGRFVGSWTFTPLLMALVLSIVFSAFGYQLQKRESAELHAVFERNLHLVSRVLEVATEHALRDGHHRDLRKIVLSVEAYDADLGVLVADAQGEVLFSAVEAHALTLDERALIEQTLATRSGQSRESGRGLERTRTVTALLDSADTPDAVLLVQKPLRELERDLARTRNHAIGTTFAMALFTLIFGLVFAHLRVREPLRKLRQMMDGFADVAGVPGTTPNRGLQSYRTDNEVRAVAEAFRDLMTRLAQTRRAVEALHVQRENLANRLADSSGRAKLVQFSSEIAHEIGSPLQVILGRATMLEDRADRPDDVRRHAQIVVEETKRIQRIVQRSLQETTELHSVLSTIDLRIRVRELAALSRLQPEGRVVAYHFDFPEEPLWIRMDADALDQILRNLIANAHEACSIRGSVHLVLTPVDDGARLVIEDTGKGMSDAMLANALLPFFSTRPLSTGHGFGLPIVQRLCRDFGITFAMHSQEGVGTKVILEFQNARTVALWEQSDG